MIEEILDTLEIFILNNLGSYLSKYSTEDVPLTAPISVIRDYPDFDKNNTALSLYVLPDYFEFEYLDVGGEYELTLRVNVYCFVRKDSTATLQLQSFRQLKAMTEMIRDNPTLGDGVQDSTLIDGDIFNDVEGDENIKGYKISLDLIEII